MENEILNTTEMQSADQQIADTANQQDDAFLKGWDDEGMPAQDSSTEEGAEDETPAETPAENTADGSTADPTAETSAATGEETPEGEKPSPLSWAYRHMGEDKTITSDEITPELLQKAADYDRVRGKYDESKPAMEIFRKFAEKANMSLSDYVTQIRTMAKEAEGMSKQEAQRAVQLKDREAAVSEKETAQNEEQTAKQQKDDKAKADLAEFQKAFPDVYEKVLADRTAIDKSVWDAVEKEGISLTAAYAKFAVSAANAAAASAKESAAADAKNGLNASRSTGSMQTAGNDKHLTDAFLQGFGD
jgi:hypothetical protein